MAILLAPTAILRPARDGRRSQVLVALHCFVGVWVFLLVPALLLLLASSLTMASSRPTPDVPMRDYTSPSGEFAVRIDPSNRYGAGPATYSFSRDGRPVLGIEHPFTLFDAVVGEDGTLAGYGYSNGLSVAHNPGEFLVAIINADGSLRMLERSLRSESPYLHTDPDPKADGLFIDSTNDRLVVRIDNPDVNKSGELWIVYGLSTGTRNALLEMSPPDTRAHWIIGVQPLQGLPLTLLHWWHGGSDNEVNDSGALFTLVDHGGNVVWDLLLSSDYAADSDEAADAIRSDVHATPAIRVDGGPGTFSLHHRQEGTAVTYRVTQGSTGWNVIESLRRPWRATEVAAPVGLQSTAVPIIEAVELGKHLLAGSKVSPDAVALGDVRTFAIDARGHFAVVIGGDSVSDGQTLRILDAAGTMLGNMLLDSWFDCQCNFHVAAKPDGRWLVASASKQQKGANATMITASANGNSADEIAGLAAPPFEALASTRDGFVALTDQWHRYTSEQALVAYREDGGELWRIDEEYGRDQAISSPEDIAVTPEGDVAVLEMTRHQLKIFEASGRHRRTIDLAKTWRRKPNYPTDLASDPTGGFVVHDFHGTPSIVRMQADGSVKREFSPKTPDGREIVVRGVDIDPTGALWISDGFALLRLDDDGIVDRTIGTLPDNDRLGDVAASVIGRDGRLYAADSRTAAVHVFDEFGESLFVCRPLPEDHQGELDVALTVGELGDVWLQPNGIGDDDGKHLHFSPDCQRLGVEKLALDSVSQTWLAARGSQNRWVLGYRKLFLVDAGGGVLATRERASDGRWLNHLGAAAVASDGTLALISDSIGSADPVRFVALFDAEAHPLGTLSIPEGFQSWHPLAFDGQRLYFGWSADRDAEPTGVTVTDLGGRPLYRLLPPSGRTIETMELIRRDGRNELWLFDGKRTVDRVALPDL